MKRELHMSQGRSRHIAPQWHQLGYPELMDIIIIIRPVLNVLVTRHHDINHRQVITIIPSKCAIADPVTAIFRIKWSCPSPGLLSRVCELHHFLLCMTTTPAVTISNMKCLQRNNVGVAVCLRSSQHWNPYYRFSLWQRMKWHRPRSEL